MSSGSTISVLTEDLLIRVNSKITLSSDRKSFRLVSKEFYKIDSLTRKTLRILHINFLLPLLNKFPHIHSLDLSVCPRIDNETVSFLYRHPSLKNVKSLNLSRATGLKHNGLKMIMKGCLALERIDLSYCCGFGDREAESLSLCSGLKELVLDKCLGMSDVGLAKIAVECLKLEKISLKWCMEISDLGIDLLCKKCVDLKMLDVSYLKVTNESLRSISSLTKLEGLAMVGCTLVDDVGCQFLEHACPLLQEIDVSRCDCVSSSGLISIVRGHSGLKRIHAAHCIAELSPALLQCMKNLKNLNTVKINGARVSDNIFQILSSYCNSLSEIVLSKCIGVTNMGIAQLISGCTELKMLSLTCCHSVTDAAISTIASSCRNLVSLQLESCHMITVKGLEQLASNCMLLQEVDLTECCGINDRGLEYLSRCSELLYLKLGLCSNISDKGLCHIASNCSKLQELDLYRCTGIGDDGLAALSSGCKRLKNLNLSYCNQITDIGMKYLGYLEELADLELRALDKITGSGLTAFAANCKTLTDLDLKHCENIDDSGFCALAYYSRNLRQINLSHCALSDTALCILMGNLTRLQDAKLVHLKNVSVEGFELALRACCVRIKKVKLVAPLRFLLSLEMLEILDSRGCTIRWD